MKSKNYWIYTFGLCFFIGLNPIKGQCPERGKPVLETQEKIDSFLAIYPNCEYIQGSMAIDNVRIYWVKEEPWKYLVVLSSILIVILGLLKLVFKKMSFFNK